MASPALVAVLVGMGVAAFLYLVFTSGDEPPHENTKYKETNHRNTQRRSWSNMIEEMKECSICLSPITSLQRVKFCDSDHAFHKECIMQWKTHGPVETRSLCPMCRRSF